jgi:hypothetical protein
MNPVTCWQENTLARNTLATNLLTWPAPGILYAPTTHKGPRRLAPGTIGGPRNGHRRTLHGPGILTRSQELAVPLKFEARSQKVLGFARIFFNTIFQNATFLFAVGLPLFL